jgi:Ca-activated chloride channel family protein
VKPMGVVDPIRGGGGLAAIALAVVVAAAACNVGDLDGATASDDDGPPDPSDTDTSSAEGSGVTGGGRGDGDGNGATETLNPEFGPDDNSTASSGTGTNAGAGGDDLNGLGGGGEGGAGGAAGEGGAGGLGTGGEAGECASHVDIFPYIASVAVDDSNSYASPLLVRELVAGDDFDVTTPLPVRPHEFLNYYAREMKDARVDEIAVEGLHLGADARWLVPATDDAPGIAELLVTFTAYGEPATQRPDVTFVLDNSTSMNGEGTERLVGVVEGAAQALAVEQEVAVLTWDPVEPVVLRMAPWDPGLVPGILDAARIHDSSADFSNALRQALAVARAQAAESQRPGVIVAVSDGSTVLDEQIVGEVEREQDLWPPVRVVAVGVGPARGYSDEVFDALTDRSGGAYFYAPDAASAQSALAARFEELTRVVARDVKLDIDMPPGVTLAAVAGGNGDPAAEGSIDRGRNLGVGGTMAFHVYLTVEKSAVACSSLNLRVSWTADADGHFATYPALPDIVELRLSDALAEGAPQPDGLVRGSAIVAAAEALRGPTPGRLQQAAVQLAGALERGIDGDGSLADLCSQVQVVCDRASAGCTTCAP